MSEAIDTANKFADKVIKKLYGPVENFQSCLLLNISQSELTENNDRFVVTVYNPFSRSVSKYIRLPVTKREHSVINEERSRQEIQYVPVFDMLTNASGRKSSAREELVFCAESIPPLGYRSFAVSTKENSVGRELTGTATQKAKMNFHPFGHVKSVTANGKEFKIQQDILYYSGASGNNMVFENRYIKERNNCSK